MNIESFWQDGVLITTAHDWVPISPEKIIEVHSLSSYGKLLNIEYSWFRRRGNHISCKFSQKVGPFSFEMKFEKVVERRSFDETRIFFKTFESKADINGWWLIKPSSSGSHLTLRQETAIPRYLRWLPVKHIIEQKIRGVYDSMRLL